MLYYYRSKATTKLKLFYIINDETCLVLKDDFFVCVVGQIIHSHVYISDIKNSGFYQLLDVRDVDVL